MVTRLENMSLTVADWCTRRGDTVRGPYSQTQIRRYILLGRLRLTDEVRPEGGGWKPLAEYPELIPEVMKLPPGKAKRGKLLIARMLADERQAGDRRRRGGEVAAAVGERRCGHERRQAQSAAILRYHALYHHRSAFSRIRALLSRHPLTIILLVILGLMFSYPG
jgi:hypothetical protein